MLKVLFKCNARIASVFQVAAFEALRRAEALAGGGAGTASSSGSQSNRGTSVTLKNTKPSERTGRKPWGSSDAGLVELENLCRQRIRICVSLSPSDPLTQRLLRRFPALMSRTSVDYFGAWEKEALISVAEQTLLKTTTVAGEAEAETCVSRGGGIGGVDSEHAGFSKAEEETRREELSHVCEACADILKATEQSAESFRREHRRFFYVTPASYLSFLEGVEALYQEHWRDTLKQRAQYALGLRKLQAASEQVFEMQTQLEMLQPELLRASDETQQLMEALIVKQEQANSTKVCLEKDK